MGRKKQCEHCKEPAAIKIEGIPPTKEEESFARWFCLQHFTGFCREVVIHTIHAMTIEIVNEVGDIESLTGPKKKIVS